MIFNPETFRELAVYDAGLLNDYGGGDVGWWQDYLRAELGRAYDFYASQIAGLVEENARQTELLRRVLAYVPSTFGVTQDIRAALERKPHD